MSPSRIYRHKEFARAIVSEIREEMRLSSPIYFAEVTGLPCDDKLGEILASGFCEAGHSASWLCGVRPDEGYAIFYGYCGTFEYAYEKFCKVAPRICELYGKPANEKSAMNDGHDTERIATLAAQMIRRTVAILQDAEPESLIVPRLLVGPLCLRDQPQPHIVFPHGQVLFPIRSWRSYWRSVCETVRQGKVIARIMETPILQAAGSVLNGYATTPVGVINAALEKAKPPFIPTPFQRAILDALKDKALRTNAIAVRLKDRRRFFREKEELETQGLLLHHARLGFYRPDAPPPELKSRSKKMASEFRTWMTS